MIIKDWLTNTVSSFTNGGIDTARLDAEVLLAELLNKDRAWIHAHPECVLQRSDLRKLEGQVERRMDHEPLAYIIGRKEFYGREFVVTSDVLVPRPETESFIELLIPLAEVRPPQGIYNVLDMGTGSGIIAITTKLELPHLNVYATDTSKKALEVAIKNSRRLDATIRFKLQSILDGDKKGYDVILANLPYVPTEMQDVSIMKEPKIALFSGADGLNHYRKLFEQLKPKHIRYVMTESLESEHGDVENLANDAGYKLLKADILVQLFEKTRD